METLVAESVVQSDEQRYQALLVMDADLYDLAGVECADGVVGCAKAPGLFPGRTGASIQPSSKKRLAVSDMTGEKLP